MEQSGERMTYAAFAEVLAIRSGRNQRAVENPKGKYPIYGSGGVIGYADEYICEGGSVIIGRKGNINNPIYAGAPFWNVDTAFGLTADTDILLPKYLYYFCKAYDFNSLNTTAAIPSLTKANLLKIKLPLPALEVQHKIVCQLEKLDSVMDGRRRQVIKLDELVRSRFLDMFGNPVHGSKYGHIKLADCATDKVDIVDGPFGSLINTGTDYIDNGEIPVIRTVNVKRMEFCSENLKFISREKYETVKRNQVIPGDVILTKVGTIGNVCVFPHAYNEAVLSTTGSCRIRVSHKKMDTVFFAHNLLYMKDRLVETASAGAQPFLNMVQVRNIDILDVPMEQQQQFAAFATEISKVKQALKKSLGQLDVLKKSYMQQYFGPDLSSCYCGTTQGRHRQRV